MTILEKIEAAKIPKNAIPEDGSLLSLVHSIVCRICPERTENWVGFEATRLQKMYECDRSGLLIKLCAILVAEIDRVREWEYKDGVWTRDENVICATPTGKFQVRGNEICETLELAKELYR